MQKTTGVLIMRGCAAVKFARSAHYQNPLDWQFHDLFVIDALNHLVESLPHGVCGNISHGSTPLPSRGITSRCPGLSNIGAQSVALDEMPAAEAALLSVFMPEGPNEVWAADFMSNAPHAARFRTCKIIDDLNRETLVTELVPPFGPSGSFWSSTR